MTSEERTAKLLEKLGKLKRHAESAEAIGNEAEAQAFADMFQKLLLDNKLEMTDHQFGAQEKVDPVDRNFIEWQDYGIKVRNNRVSWIEDLALITAHAYFCTVLVFPKSSYLAIVGRKQDRAIAEYMIVTLVRAVEKLADAEYAKFSTECVKECGYCADWYRVVVTKKDHTAFIMRHNIRSHEFDPNWKKCRGFRPAFIQAFIRRLMHRYSETRKARVSTSTALVRVERTMQPVLDWVKQHAKRKATDLNPA